MSTKQSEMSFVEHLLELRTRLVRVLIALGLIFAALFPFANEIYEYVALPILSVLPENAGLIAIGVISPFLTPLKLTLMCALYIAMPYLLHQLWAYVAPALYKREKSIAMPLLISSIILFYAGLLFCYFIVMPLAFAFLTTIGPSIISITPDIQYYLDFVIKMSFAFGVAFEVPVATILMLMSGATTVEKLQKQRPYFVVIAFVIGMLLTPPDIISQILISLPMWLLFELGIFIYRLMPKRQEKAKATENNAD